MVRVTLAGDELEGFEQPAPTQHVKVILPEPGQSRPALPDPSLPRGASEPGQPRPLMRTYTIRRYDAGARELDIDFVLHGEGAASNWAATAKPGGIVALAGPGGRPYSPRLDASWYVLAGDESALPAMATVLERLPASIEAHVYAEVEGPEEHVSFATGAKLDLAWLHRGSRSATPGSLVVEELGRAGRPAGDGQAWLACEANIMRRIRRQLQDGWGLEPSAMVTRGYWKVGEINYPDHDYGED